MKAVFLAAACAVVVSACAPTQYSARNAPFQEAAGTFDSSQVIRFRKSTEDPTPGIAPISDTPLTVEKIEIAVPKSLEVSEANKYLPQGDIVWRGDPMGDRHEQVRKIFEEAFSRGTAGLDGGTPVSIYAHVVRFHALTEKARYSVGGVHVITFGLAVRNLETGEFIGEPYIVRADLDAFGGALAVRADARGETQKVRITEHLSQVIRQELTRPEGFRNPRLGIIQAIHEN